ILLVLLSSRSPVLVDEELVELLILAVEDALYLRWLRIVYNYLCPSIISITVPLGDPGSRIPEEYSLLDRGEQSITYRCEVLREVRVGIRVYCYPRKLLKHFRLRLRAQEELCEGFYSGKISRSLRYHEHVSPEEVVAACGSEGACVD